MDDYAKIVGRNLHDLRSAYRMTQVDLGKKLQCGEANISYWERGKAVPRGDYLPVLAKIFHVSIDSLFGMDRATGRIMELQTENTALRRQIENLTSAQAAMVKEFDKKLEELHEAKSELASMRNELCYLCGKYRDAHNGACDGCRWKEAALKGGEG